jgi:GT2 family glycosyltransferase
VLPLASIVVATHNRASTLSRLLDSLVGQAAGVPFEVIVVDDASTDATADLLRRASAESPLDLRVLRLDANRGPATARNLGWRTARAELICFTDDDCVPHPGWVAALVGASRDVDIVQGRTVPAPDQSQHSGPFSHTMAVPHEDGLYSTCNIAYRRSTLEGVDGFDEAFTMAYGEDTDLAWRAIDRGATTAFVPEAIVEHDVRPSSFRDHLRGLRRREGLVHAVHKHPRLRAALPYRGYVQPPHLRAVVLLASVAVVAVDPASAPRWLVAVAAAAWYAHGCRRYRMAPPNRWAWLPALPLALMADLVELSVLVRASVRYREVML